MRFFCSCDCNKNKDLIRNYEIRCKEYAEFCKRFSDVSEKFSIDTINLTEKMLKKFLSDFEKNYNDKINSLREYERSSAVSFKGE